MGIKYYHSAPQQIRLGYFLADAEGNEIYMYSGSTFVKNMPRITICSILDGNKLSFGYATCSSKDQYKKKIGQSIAKIRAEKKPYKVIELDDLKDVHIISDKIIDEIYDLETKRIYG